jgi:hypothetical protein
MLDLSNVRKVDQETVLFISWDMAGQAAWLLKQADPEHKEIKIYDKNKVLENKIPEVARIRVEDREKQMLTHGFDEDEMKFPVAIVSHYDIDELFEKLRFIQEGDDDPDYEKHNAALQARTHRHAVYEKGIRVWS